MDESKFNMWRAFAGMAKIDGTVSSEEESFIREKLDGLDLNDEQKATLNNDLEKGIDLNQVFDKITQPSDRAMLLHFARIVFFKDGDYSKEEQWCYDSLNDEILKALNTEKIIEEAKAAVKEIENDRQKNTGSLGFSLLMKFFRS